MISKECIIILPWSNDPCLGIWHFFHDGNLYCKSYKNYYEWIYLNAGKITYSSKYEKLK